MDYIYSDGYVPRRGKKSKFDVAFESVIGKRKLKHIETPIEDFQKVDFYRFFKKHGKIIYSQVMLDKTWGHFFKEAIITYGDFIAVIHPDNEMAFEKERYLTVYHRQESELTKLLSELGTWVKKNSIFRGQQFTFPDLEKPKMAKAYFTNDSDKKLVEENTVLFFRKLKQLKARNIKTKRGVILYGDPGNGKTSICRWISKSLPDVTRIWVTTWAVKGRHIHDLFEIARTFSPSIIFMEDIDTAGVSRHRAGINPVLGRLLNEMDGINTNDSIVVVATTNDIASLDRAIANRPGRFDTKIYIGNPHPNVVKRITGHEDDITLAEAFRRKQDRIYYEKILGRKYRQSRKQESLHYIG